MREFIIECIEAKRDNYIDDMENKFPPCILKKSENQISMKEHSDKCNRAIEIVKKLLGEKK